MDGGRVAFKMWFSLRAAHTRLKHCWSFTDKRAGRFQNVVLAVAPRTFAPEGCKSFTDGGRVVFTMGLSPWRSAQSHENPARAPRMEGGPLSSWGLAL
eukprot:4834645-Pyramimonas_sp.AAC.1